VIGTDDEGGTKDALIGAAGAALGAGAGAGALTEMCGWLGGVWVSGTSAPEFGTGGGAWTTGAGAMVGAAGWGLLGWELLGAVAEGAAVAMDELDPCALDAARSAWLYSE
jgi:hypothetical protein